MNEIKIEEYRGFTIVFNTSTGKFGSELSSDNTKESLSFTAIKKCIDDFKKENQNFKPFYVIPNPKSGYKSDKVFITGIRKDNRFVGTFANGEVTQISDYDLEGYILDKTENEYILNEILNLDIKRREYIDHADILKREFISRLNIVTLKEHKKQMK